MKTDATLHSLIMVGTAVYGRQRYRVAKAWARAGSLSQTATKSDSGKALSASAWIWPTLPQPIRAVRTRFIASPRKMDCAHPPEERQRLGHLFHTVHPVLDAHPALVMVPGQDGEDRIVVIQSPACDSVAKVGRITERSVGLAKFLERRSLSQVPVAGVHTDHAIGDRAEQCDRVVTGHDGVGGIILHAEVPPLRNGIHQRQEDVLLLGKLGIFPEAVLVVVFQTEHDIVFAGDGKHSTDAVDDPGQTLPLANLRIALPGEDPADRSGTTEPPGRADQFYLPVDRSLAPVGVGVREVGRKAEHRHRKAGLVNRLAHAVDVRVVQTREEAIVHLQSVGIEGTGHVNPVEDRHRPVAGNLLDVALRKGGKPQRHGGVSCRLAGSILPERDACAAAFLACSLRGWIQRQALRNATRSASSRVLSCWSSPEGMTETLLGRISSIS